VFFQEPFHRDTLNHMLGNEKIKLSSQKVVSDAVSLGSEVSYKDHALKQGPSRVCSLAADAK